MKNDQNNRQAKVNNIDNINGRGNISVKRKFYTDDYSRRDWYSLISKNKLCYDIWMFLTIYRELNVTQISKYVKRSKSTVSRILKGMKIDGLLTSRRAEIKEGERERIPPKYYRISDQYKQEVEIEKIFMEVPSDPQELHDFLLNEIQNYRNSLYNIVRLTNYLRSSLNYLKDKLEDIEEAKEIYKKTLFGINEPEFNLMFLDEKQFKKFYNLRTQYVFDLKKLAMEHKAGNKNAFVYFDSLLPFKALLELDKELK